MFGIEQRFVFTDEAVSEYTQIVVAKFPFSQPEGGEEWRAKLEGFDSHDTDIGDQLTADELQSLAEMAIAAAKKMREMEAAAKPAKKAKRK